MKKQIQITAASIDEVMNEMNKVATELRMAKTMSTECALLVDYEDRLNARIELHLKAKDARRKSKEF